MKQVRYRIGELYDMTDVAGKSIYSKSSVNIRSLPDINSKLISTVTGGDLIGIIYSHIQRNGKTWWMMQGGGYVLHNPDYIDIKASEQGLRTVTQKIEAKKLADAKENETLGDKFSNFFSPTGSIIKYGIPIAIGLGVLMILNTVSGTVKNFQKK